MDSQLTMSTTEANELCRRYQLEDYDDAALPDDDDDDDEPDDDEEEPVAMAARAPRRSRAPDAVGARPLAEDQIVWMCDPPLLQDPTITGGEVPWFPMRVRRAVNGGERYEVYDAFDGPARGADHGAVGTDAVARRRPLARSHARLRSLFRSLRSA